jgi:hypothetical protein
MAPMAAPFLSGLKPVAHSKVPELYRMHAARSAESTTDAHLELLPERVCPLATVSVLCLFCKPPLTRFLNFTSAGSNAEVARLNLQPAYVGHLHPSRWCYVFGAACVAWGGNSFV